MKSLRIVPFALLGIFAIACTGTGELGGNQPPAGNPDAGDPGTDPDPDAPDADVGEPDDGRVKNGIVALYKFKEGTGTLVADSSGVLPALDLTIADPAAATWMPGGGVNVIAPTIIQSGLPAQKVFDACVASNQITYEAWVRPANLEQTGPARILTNSIDAGNRNFALGQAATVVSNRLRTTITNNNGTPAVDSLPDALGLLSIQHLVYTRDAAWSSVYIDGVKVATDTIGGKQDNWDPTYPLAIANEVSLDRPWLGEIYLAAVYCRRLGTAEVQQNFAARF